MGRWEPDAQRRLREAALELFETQGYDHTTVAEIAAAAGVTPRTFFRHFADKREVLFSGSAQLEANLVAAVDATPAELAPFDAAAHAVEVAFAALGTTRAAARRRQTVIMATRELRERELIKMAALADALADGLRRRGASDAEALLAAEAAISAMRVAFARWAGRGRGPALGDELRATVRDLRAVTASPG